MRAVVDSSTLISLAWAGQLSLLARSPVALVVPEAVRHETVVDGMSRGYPDAAAIEVAVKDLPVATGAQRSAGQRVDDVVLDVSRQEGLLLTNDLALGRRALNVGARWLRTADLVVLCVRAGRLDAARGSAALRALRGAGRMTEELLHTYLTELP